MAQASTSRLQVRQAVSIVQEVSHVPTRHLLLSTAVQAHTVVMGMIVVTHVNKVIIVQNRQPPALSVKLVGIVQTLPQRLNVWQDLTVL